MSAIAEGQKEHGEDEAEALLPIQELDEEDRVGSGAYMSQTQRESRHICFAACKAHTTRKQTASAGLHSGAAPGRDVQGRQKAGDGARGTCSFAGK